MKINKPGNSSNLAPEWIYDCLHTGSSDHVSNPYPALGETVSIRLEVPALGNPDQIVLRSIPNGEQQFQSMRLVNARGSMNIWEAEILVNEPRVLYRFAIQDNGQIWWLNAAGVSSQVPFGLFDFKLLANFPEIPWLSSSVFYQIFPDRFANGDPSNDPNGAIEAYPGYSRKTHPWGQVAEENRKVFPFYGGDLKGIEDNLAHLQQLGVNALYLNPIFTAYTNHRYDVADFRNVDPTLGGNEAFVSLSKSIKALNMRIILDIVPNHCGAGHPWFQEAHKDPESPRRSAFFFGNDNDYVSWMGFGSLPKLNYNDSFMRAEIFESDSSVFATWMLPPYSVDGWRVDVGNMLGRYNEHQLDAELLPAIRKAVKRVNPQSYLMGENFFEAVGQLQGNAWDGVMNYSGFTEPTLHWLSGFSLDALRCKAELVSEKPITTETLVKTWQDNLAAIPWAVALQQFNLLGSHDTSRLGSVLKGDDELIRMAVMIQFTFPGVPCVYYGDEIGLSNEAGFAQRNCFPWDKSTWDVDLFSFYQKLIALRKENQILAQGSFQILYWDEDIIIYQRLLAGERVLVTANRGEIREGFSFRSPWVETDSSINLVGLFCGKQITLTNTEIKIPALAKGGEIWLSSSS